jgi:hypothetical protein
MVYIIPVWKIKWKGSVDMAHNQRHVSRVCLAIARKYLCFLQTQI